MFRPMRDTSDTRSYAFPGVDADSPPETLSSLETPVPVVDLDVLASNLDRMASYTTLHGLALRPQLDGAPEELVHLHPLERRPEHGVRLASPKPHAPDAP